MLVSRPLAGRYVFTKRIRGTQRTIIWLARDQGTGVPVVASVLPGPRAQALEPARGLRHEHAAAILKVVDRPSPKEIPDEEAVDEGARVVVAEYVEGRSLQQRLDAGPVATETAVEWIACAADALSKLHERGAVHGGIAPRALIVVRRAEDTVPILTHLIVPPSGAFCSPERVTGGGPSETDDVWALAATLYSALSRRAPFQGSSRTELARAIVAASPPPLSGVDPALESIVKLALARDPKHRLSTAAGLRDMLRDWMDQTGARSLGDFAPVAALVGASEPPPNVGDLSLVAALVKPDSPEANAPFRVDTFPPERAEKAKDADDLVLVPSPTPSPTSTQTSGGLAEVSALSASIFPTLPKPPDPPTPTPAVAAAKAASGPPAPGPAAAPGPRRGAGKKVVILGLVALLSAASGLVLGKMRGAAKAREAARATVTASVPTPPAAASPAATTPPGATGAPLEAVSAPAPSSPLAIEAPSPEAAPSGSAQAPGTAVAAATPLDVTACVRGTLQPLTIGPSAADLGYLCTQKDLWGIGRKFDQTIARTGLGPGMVQWAHLGRFDLAAIAVLIGRCCPAAVEVVTATPRGVCTALDGAVRDVLHDPSAANVDRYADAVDCLVSRGVKYPAEWWDRVAPKDARRYFDLYLAGLRTP